MPTGAGLRDALLADFAVDTEGEEVSLAEAYGHVLRLHKASLESYLHDWFTGCQTTWQHLFSEFNWHRIWTFNIDDALEAAFEKESRPFKTLTWNERFSDHRASEFHQIIHLHGSANQIISNTSTDSVLVFSISEYVQAVSDPRTWHKVFFDEFSERPFLIIGARLTEEFDLAEVLHKGTVASKATGYPSVVVLQSVTSFQRSRLVAAGLVVIESDGETFVRDLLDHYRSVLNSLDEVYGAMTPAVRRFQQQFIDLRMYDPVASHSQDFYSGYQPTWNTIQNDDDAILEISRQASELINKIAMDEEVSQEIHLLTGDAGSGKSTCLLRIAKNLIGVGARPFLFRADETIDLEATVGWLKLVPRSILLFDDSAEFSSAIQDLAEKCTAEGVRMVSVIADRSARLRLVTDRIDAAFLRPERPHWCGRLSNQDIDLIIEKLHARGRLGQITRYTKESQRSYFVETAGRRVFDAMANLEGGPGFKDKIRSIYGNLASDNLKNLYSAACLCYEQGLPIPTGIAVEVSNILPRDLISILEHDCRGVLVLTKQGIRPPHRITSTIVVNDVLTQSTRFRVTLSLAMALASHIDLQAIRSETREYRIARNLMDQELVVRRVGEHNAREWYEKLRDWYSWNGRYWDQRALLESRLGDHPTARSYAERSIQVHQHSFGYNTLGTVLRRMAIESGNQETLLEGIKNLESAQAFQKWGTRGHPFMAFFSSMIRYAERWGVDAVPDQARNAWTAWIQEANLSPLFSEPAERRLLSKWHRTWLGFAVVRTPYSTLDG